MLEQVYLCWHAGQSEADAKELKATSGEEAARMAVDIWRHEEFKELGSNKVTVFVKDEDQQLESFQVSNRGDSHAPEAFR